MPRRSKSLQPPSDHGGTEDDLNSSDSLEREAFNGTAEDVLVQLNVGGRKFDTTEATLGARGQNFLTSLVTSQMPSMRDSQGRFFIDRSGALFEILLEYLRTRVLRIPPNLPIEAVDAEADFYGIPLPHHSQAANKLNQLALGLFVSSKYAENELVIFSDICTGYIVRGGTSKVQFRYRTDGDGVIEVVWLTEKKQRHSSRIEKSSAAPYASSSSPSRPLSTSGSRRHQSHSEARTSTPTVEPLASPSAPVDDASAASVDYTKSTVWFLQDKELITSASNSYTFVPNVTSFASSIFTNSKSGISIYDGMVAGFRLPKCDAPPPLLLSAGARKRQSDRDEGLESPPPMSPKSDHLDSHILSSDSEASDEARDAVFVDIRNQWVKCEFSSVAYCDSVVAYQVVCRPIESVRYKSSLPYPFGGNNEYEWCREAFTIELIILSDYLIARLVSYNLIRKDRSLVTMQYSAAFHRFPKLHGPQPPAPVLSAD